MPTNTRKPVKRHGGSCKSGKRDGRSGRLVAPKSGYYVQVAPKKGTFLAKSHSGGQLLGLRSQLGLTRAVFSRLLPVSERSLANIEAGHAPSAAFERRHRELDRIVQALSEVMRAEVIGKWLQEPNDGFAGLKPLEIIERGETDRIWEMIYRIRSGAVT